MTALTLPVLLTTEPTRFDGIHALLLAPFVAACIFIAALAVAYVSGVLRHLPVLVDRLIDWALPPYRLDMHRTDQIRKGETK